MPKEKAPAFIYGHHAVVEALKQETAINKLWLQPGLQPRLEREVSQLAKKQES